MKMMSISLFRYSRRSAFFLASGIESVVDCAACAGTAAAAAAVVALGVAGAGVPDAAGMAAVAAAAAAGAVAPGAAAGAGVTMVWRSAAESTFVADARRVV